MTDLALHVDPQAGPGGDGSHERPFVRLEDALVQVRARRLPGQRGVLWLHEGTHALATPLSLGPEDSRITLAAWPGTAPVIDGGTVLDEWSPATLHGREVWCAPAPQRCGRALFIDGRRVPRPRLPRHGHRRMAPQPGVDLAADPFLTLFAGSSTAVVEPAHLDGVEVVDGLELVVSHFWTQERLPVTGVDRDTGRVTSSRRSIFEMRDGIAPEPARWWLEGVHSGLGEVPGEWILDRESQLPLDGESVPAGPRVAYAPRAHERIEHLRAVVPVHSRLLSIAGTAEQPVRDVRIEGIAFRHAEWPAPPEARVPFGIREDPELEDVAYASDNQAACTVPGAIEMSFAHGCSVIDCVVESVGGFGIRLDDGVRECLIGGTVIRDTGAGAIACGGAPQAESAGGTHGVEISDCHLTEGGRTYPQAAAVLIRHAARVRVLHNDISDHPSTGIAVGWRWDYGPSAAVDNLIEGNHLHRLGGGEVDWFGAIYTLGVSTGTRIRRNLIHDVHASRFGGWGLLIDPSSSYLVIEENTIHEVSAECVHIKTGRANVLRRNILANGRTGLVSLAVDEQHVAATLTEQLLLPGALPVFTGAPGSLDAEALVASAGLRSDANIVWAGPREPTLAGDVERAGGGWHLSSDLSQTWRASGRDATTVVLNPRIVTGAHGRLWATSPQITDRGGWTGADLVVGPRTPPASRSQPSITSTRSTP